MTCSLCWGYDMGYRFICEDRIEVEDGQLVRIVNARWATKKTEGNIDVYKVYEDGHELVRNLNYNYYGFYYLYTAEVEEWSEPIMTLNSFKKNRSMAITDEEIELVKSRHPGFKWLLDKVVAVYKDTLSRAKMWEFMEAWKRWPECERLFNGGYEKLCLSTPFAKAPYKKQHKMFEFLQSHPEVKDPGWSELNYIMQKSITQEEYWLCRNLQVGIEEYRYLCKQRTAKHSDLYSLKRLYRDYINMAENNKHDVKDDYWKWPKNLCKAHAKVMTEYYAIIEAERLARAKELRREEREKKKKFVAIAKKFAKSTARFDGLKAYVPQDIRTVNEQANALHQCLMSADYIGTMADRECLLLFIADNAGNPVATAEITPQGKVAKFYANQADFDSDKMKPSDAAQKALDMWVYKFKKDAVKVMKEAA